MKVQQITKREVLIATIALLVGVGLGFYSRGGAIESPKFSNTTQNNSLVAKSENPMAFFTTVETSKSIVYLLIKQDSIYFNPFEANKIVGKSMTINKTSYPKLFQQEVAGQNVIEANLYVDQKTGQEFVELSNNQPDHGGLASTYVLLVNPFTGEAKEGQSYYEEKIEQKENSTD